MRDTAMNNDTTYIANRMLSIWVCGLSMDSGLSLSPARKRTLHSLFTDVFSSSLARWEEFVDLIGGCSFLQQKFRYRGELFDWATNFESCRAVLKGAGTAGYITDEFAEALLASEADDEPISQS